MTVRRYSDGTVVSDAPTRLCNRYSYDSQADAAIEALAKSRGVPAEHRQLAYVCDMCNQWHVGVKVGKKARRARARAAAKVGKHQRARRRVKESS